MLMEISSLTQRLLNNRMSKSCIDYFLKKGTRGIVRHWSPGVVFGLLKLFPTGEAIAESTMGA